jgi:hypothetical protein
MKPTLLLALLFLQILISVSAERADELEEVALIANQAEKEVEISLNQYRLILSRIDDKILEFKLSKENREKIKLRTAI